MNTPINGNAYIPDAPIPTNNTEANTRMVRGQAARLIVKALQMLQAVDIPQALREAADEIDPQGHDIIRMYCIECPESFTLTRAQRDWYRVRRPHPSAPLRSLPRRTPAGAQRRSGRSAMTGQVFMIAGFVLAIVGLMLISVPIALVVAGAVLFLAGGFEVRQSAR